MENISNRIFIHYGHTKFDDNLWEEIINMKFCKPYGGLWASDINAKFGWKNWNEISQFRKCDEKKSFKFKLKSNTRLLSINTMEELERVPLDPTVPVEVKTIFYALDFENIKENYDAIEVNISNDKSLYWALYGWDCDTLLVLNKKCIELIN